MVPEKNEGPFMNIYLLVNGPYKLLEGKHRGLSSQQKKHKPSIKNSWHRTTNNSLLVNGPYKLLEGKHRGPDIKQNKTKPKPSMKYFFIG